MPVRRPSPRRGPPRGRPPRRFPGPAAGCSPPTASGMPTSAGSRSTSGPRSGSPHVTDRNLHPDFGPAYGDAAGAVRHPGDRRRRRAPRSREVRLRRRERPGRIPFGTDTKIEGGRDAGGDRHAIVVDASTCRLYETCDTRVTAAGWTAGSGAMWSLRSTSCARAAGRPPTPPGLPILPGLLRCDEVRRGRVDHAIRFTTDVTDRRYVWPARHRPARSRPVLPADGCAVPAQDVVPHQGLLRGRAGGPQGDEDATAWCWRTTASPGTSRARPTRRWTGGCVQQLKRIPASAFQAVDTAPLRIRAGSASPAPDPRRGSWVSPRGDPWSGAVQLAGGLGDRAGDRRVDRERVRQLVDGQPLRPPRARPGRSARMARGATTTPPTTMPVPGRQNSLTKPSCDRPASWPGRCVASGSLTTRASISPGVDVVLRSSRPWRSRGR